MLMNNLIDMKLIDIKKQKPSEELIFVTDGETPCFLPAALFNAASDDQRIAQLFEDSKPLLKKNVIGWALGRY